MRNILILGRCRVLPKDTGTRKEKNDHSRFLMRVACAADYSIHQECAERAVTGRERGKPDTGL